MDGYISFPPKRHKLSRWKELMAVHRPREISTKQLHRHVTTERCGINLLRNEHCHGHGRIVVATGDGTTEEHYDGQGKTDGYRTPFFRGELEDDIDEYEGTEEFDKKRLEHS